VLGDRYDCDDATSQRAPSNLEVCDLLDNDCDDAVDESVDYESLPRVSRMCVAGETEVTCESAWAECDDDMTELCETARGTLSNCRACGQSCRFSCGAAACDELVAAALGGQHGCALSEAGFVACWGNNARGQLGIDSTNNAAIATRVFELPAVTKLALGARHSCAIAGTDAILHCWGDNAYSQLGVLGVADPSTIPRKVTGLLASYLTAVSDVALGPQHTCAVRSGGQVACWGAGENGRLGDDDAAAHTALGPQQARRLAPHEFIDDATRIVAGAKHTCIVNAQAEIECWGDNTSAQLGVGNTNAPASATAAIPSTGLGEVTDIVAGAYHTCALRDGRVYCWGSNFYGQLGRALDSGASSDGNALEVPGLSDIASITAGDFFSCALSKSGTLSCWGNNGDRQLGAAVPATSASPIPLGLQGIRSAAASGAAVCALDGSSQLYCWGSNAAGQLGRGPSGPESQSSPEPIHWLAGSTP
jgi:alpha-tubulin suppressor-like RCC1 family protein